jgi:hypothetical protein
MLGEDWEGHTTMAEEQTEQPPQVRFDFIKSNAFRVVHADGIWGGPTPNGLLLMAFFNERVSIPTQVTHAVKPDGSLGPETERIRRSAIVREVEVAVMLNPHVARSIRDWLTDKLEKLEKMTEADRS